MDHKVADIKKYFDDWVATQFKTPKDKSDLWKILQKFPKSKKPIDEETSLDIAMELHGACFGEMSFFRDTKHANEWIGSVDNAFKMISWVQEYEMENLDEINTDLADAIDVAHSYILYKAIEEAITFDWLVDTMIDAEVKSVDKWN